MLGTSFYFHEKNKIIYSTCVEETFVLKVMIIEYIYICCWWYPFLPSLFEFNYDVWF